MLHRPMPLAPDEVRVWQASVAATPRPDPAALAGEDWDRARRFRHQERRHAFLVARATLRGVLAHELGEDLSALRFGTGPHGKPVLDPVGALRFNLSHSGDIVLVAVAGDREVGVDVEKIKPHLDHDALARRFFSAHENRHLATVAPESRRDAFFAAWTCKEALLKAWGVGLSLPLDRFDVSVSPERPAQLLGVREGPGAVGAWSVHRLEPGPGYAAAVAMAGADASVTWRRWLGTRRSPPLRGGELRR